LNFLTKGKKRKEKQQLEENNSMTQQETKNMEIDKRFSRICFHRTWSKAVPKQRTAGDIAIISPV